MFIYTIICSGRDKQSLEITRLGIQLKIKKRLKKKYSKKIDNIIEEYDEKIEHKSSNKVWFCWLQGIENAPKLVQKCYDSIKENLDDKEIILITEKNMSEYVVFPEYILEKWKKRLISNTHLTDLLRLELLIKYGGMWVDATVLCTKKSSNIPKYYFESDLFFYQCLKPGKDGHSITISSWLMSAKSNNLILIIARDLCYDYWKSNNKMIDYFLLHYFISIALECCPNEAKKIVPVSNSTPHILLLKLFDDYDEKIWNYLKEQVPFHKLTYKFDSKDTSKKDTYYKKIID